MIIHYNCTIGSILLDSFLLIYHPYPPSFHEMIFILVPWFSHKSTPRTQAMCLLANRIFVLSSPKHLGIKLQTANILFEKTPWPCHEVPTQQGRSARSALMRMRT